MIMRFTRTRNQRAGPNRGIDVAAWVLDKRRDFAEALADGVDGPEICACDMRIRWFTPP